MAFLTSGKIAKQLNVDRDAVVYAIRKLRIEPQGTAGNVGIYTESDLNQIQAFVNRKGHRRGVENTRQGGAA